MAERAKIFKSGGSQAVRLPKQHRFEDGEEVLIYRQGRRVILNTRDLDRVEGLAVENWRVPAHPTADPGPS